MRRSLLPLSPGAAGGPEHGSARGGEAARGRVAPSPPPAGHSSTPEDNREHEGSEQSSSPWHQAYLFVHLDVQAVGHLVVLPGEKAASAGSGMASPLRRWCTSSARRHRRCRAPQGTRTEVAFTSPFPSCCSSNTMACLGAKDGALEAGSRARGLAPQPKYAGEPRHRGAARPLMAQRRNPPAASLLSGGTH